MRNTAAAAVGTPAAAGAALAVGVNGPTRLPSAQAAIAAVATPVVTEPSMDIVGRDALAAAAVEHTAGTGNPESTHADQAAGTDPQAPLLYLTDPVNIAGLADNLMAGGVPLGLPAATSTEAAGSATSTTVGPTRASAMGHVTRTTTTSSSVVG